MPLPHTHLGSVASAPAAPSFDAADQSLITFGCASLFHPQELKELISSYQSMREQGRGPAICSTIIETARQCNLDKDVSLPEEDAKDIGLEGRDSVVGQVYSR